MLRAGYGIKALQYSWGNYVVKQADVGGPEVERRCNAVSYFENGDPNFEGMYAGEWRRRLIGFSIVVLRACTPVGSSRFLRAV